MWIDEKYYNELLNAIEEMAEGRFDFNKESFNLFKAEKYEKLTNALIKVRTGARNRIDKIESSIDSIIDGNYELIDEKNFPLNEYKVFYLKHNELVKHLTDINNKIDKVQENITKNGKINSRIETRGLKGKWFDTVSNVNLTLESLSTPIDEITSVINNVAKGNLNKKMRLKIDDSQVL